MMKLIVRFTFVALSICQILTESEKLENENVSDAERNIFKSPVIPKSAYFALYFTEPSDLTTKLTVSEAKKEGVEQSISKYDGIWSVEVPSTSALLNDYGLILRSKAKHHAISTIFERPFEFHTVKQLVVQYEVKFENGQECGGAYVKLLREDSNFRPQFFNDQSPYTIMFGPDRCGLDQKFHFIYQHKNPKTGLYEEKHAKKTSASLEKYFTDKKSHLYTLVVNSDNTFEMFIDQSLVNSGSLLEDFEPSVIPPKEIDDPNDKKDESWDDRPKIVDISVQKPEDWDESQSEYIADDSAKKPEGWLDDEPKTISDPAAKKPTDWDADMDGEWEAPKIDNPTCKLTPGCGEWKSHQIKNPLYKGKWSPPLISNPNYKGVWKPRKIANPFYFEETNPFRSLSTINALGLELWSMSDNIVFDNFIVTDSKHDADIWAEVTWSVKAAAERRADPSSQSVVDAVRDLTNEKPWIWAVFMIVVVLPIVLVIAYCCLKGGDRSSSVDAQYKKTDEVVEDDNDELEDLTDANEESNISSGLIASEEETESSSVRRRFERGGKSDFENVSAEEEESTSAQETS